MNKMNVFARAILLVVSVGNSLADNPIVQTIYTADPAPVVHDGVCYVYTGHDEDVLVKNFFTMKDWRCFSSTDMVNWTDHGAVATLYDFKWADPAVSGWGGFENGAWALHAVERDGKWYLYCPLQGRGIGVLVADNPFGPFSDPIGKPLIAARYDSIDPAVFIDDDGQAYLYWGNPRCWYVKLNRDMISFDTRIGEQGHVLLDMTVAAFGERTKVDEKRPTSYEEGPWLYQRQGLYYLFFAGGPISEHLAYSTGKSPVGPWTYRGVVMPTQGKSFTNHGGVVDFKGGTYLFYHNGDLPGGGGFHRSVCVDELTFAADGSVVTLNMTKEGARQVGRLDPFQKVEAETICWTGGVETEPCTDEGGGMQVVDIDNGDHIKIKGVDFGPTGASRFEARVASTSTGGGIELRLGGLDGKLIGTCAVPAAGEKQTWENISCGVEGAAGVHDLCLKFTSGAGDLFALNWWTFTKK